MQPKNKTKPSRKEKKRARIRACFKCKEKGHLIAACPFLLSEVRSDPTGQIGQTGWCPESPTSPLQEQASHEFKGDA